MHEFTIKNGQYLLTFHNYEDIPDQFDHLISFEPDVPEGPHTPEEHKEIGEWNKKLQLLMERETGSQEWNSRAGRN